MGPGYLVPLLGQRAPLWLPGLVWSLGPWLRLRGRPTGAHRGGPPPGVQDRLVACALGGCGSGWVHPQGKRGCSAACGQKMAALHRLRPALQSGCWRGPSSRVCACARVWEGAWSFALQGSQWGPLLWAGPHGRCGSCGLDPERQEDHCILEASGLYPRIVR